jgi:putative transposase
MKNKNPSKQRSSECWAHFRFSVVGALLAAPPGRGELQQRLAELAAKAWRHPISGDWFRLGLSTIERWYYAARNEPKSPVDVLQRKIRKDQGTHWAVNARQSELIHAQYHQHPNWSYQLHCDNLAALINAEPDLGKAPSYPSVLRYMKTHGLIKRPRRGPVSSPGAVQAELRFESREVRSYESAFVNALWHLDFHHGSLRVLLPQGKYAYPLLLAVMDDRSRLCAHAQWYLSEGAEELVHGLCQALEKRGLPRALMHDNGSAMIAAETEQGLKRLSILQENTLPYSPYQNGKQETFWAQIEGRLLAMLEGVKDLTLARLNEATIAWVEMEYHRRIHREIASTPLECFLNQKDVGRPCPSSGELRLAFTTEVQRVQRRSDGTISLEGIRYEIPARYGHLERVHVRYASWQRGRVHLCDSSTGKILSPIYPLDKKKNAVGKRAIKAKPSLTAREVKPSGIAPLLENLIAQYAATGLPPAYLPKETNHHE